MKNLSSWSCLASLLVGGVLSLHDPAAATTAVAPMSLERLAEIAELSVRGEVESVDSFVEGDRIFTEVVLQVLDVLAGTPESDRVTVRMYGGIADGKITRVLGGACFTEGEEVVVFLQRSGPATWGVVNLAEGKLRVVRDGRGAPRVVRDLHEIAYLNPSTTAFPESLPELAARVYEVRR